MQYLGYSYTQKLLATHLKLKFNWVACILSGNPTPAHPLLQVPLFWKPFQHSLLCASLAIPGDLVSGLSLSLLTQDLKLCPQQPGSTVALLVIL
jgi:hypothetical protein